MNTNNKAVEKGIEHLNNETYTLAQLRVMNCIKGDKKLVFKIQSIKALQITAKAESEKLAKVVRNLQKENEMLKKALKINKKMKISVG